MEPNQEDSGTYPLFEAAKAVSEDLDADVILINGGIYRDLAQSLFDKVKYVPAQSRNAFVILVTTGGDGNAAYRIARMLQRRYTKVTICVAGDCYSAGTTIVLGAHELVMTDRGELGPIDVQLIKKDELREQLSGLTVNIALDELTQQSSKAFVYFVRHLNYVFGPQISFKTALDVAAGITSSLYGEVYKQVDPVRMGEHARILSLAKHYGERLALESRNVKPDTVKKLLNDYPSHGAVIDVGEAYELFENVRPPSIEESYLLETFDQLAVDPSYAATLPGGIIMFYKESFPDTGNQNDDNDDGIDEDSTDDEAKDDSPI